VTQLRGQGVQVFVTSRGGVKGRLQVDLSSFEGADVAQLQSEQAFVVIDSQQLVFAPPSSLAPLGPIEFAGAQDRRDLEARVRTAWSAWWAGQRDALARARSFASNAAFCVEPWRIEADVDRRAQIVRILFAPEARRAVVVAVAGRPVCQPPAEPRVLIPIDPALPRERVEAALDRAVEQAWRYAPRSEDLAEAVSLSLDLGTVDLAAHP